MKKKTKDIILFLLLLVGASIFMLPFLIMIGNAFEEFTFSLPNPPRILPSKFTLANFEEVIVNYKIFNYFGNSITIALLTTTFTILLSAMSAYGFAKIPFKGREVLFKIYLFTLMIPGVLNIIPQFMIINKLGMIGTRPGLILLYVSTSICGNTFFLRGFFQSIPNELTESVVVDGGSHMTIFRKIILPLSKPAIATLSILILLGTWDDFLTAKIILGANEKILTLPIVIHRINGQHATKFGLVFAASLITLLPVMIMYIVNQKYFVVGGMGEGAIKE